VAEAARQSAQYFVNSRWLGGTLTNWQTISQSISRLRELESTEAEGLTKKERLLLDRERERLDRDLGGIKGHGEPPQPAVRDRHEQGSQRHQGSPPG